MNETWWVSSGQLDVDQKKILQASPDESLLIIGPPGSGKTNILILRANYVRATHPRLMFLTFTRTLTEFLRSGPSIGRADQLQPNEISTFMAWGKRTLQDAGMVVPASSGKFNTDRVRVVEALRQYIDQEHPGKLYDVILVDEVQDFLADEMEVIGQLAERVNAAGDSRQAIWDHREGLPAASKLVSNTVELRNHYRIGKKICSFADRILPPKLGGKALVDDCMYDEDTRPSSINPIFSLSITQQYIDCLSEVKKQLRYIVDEPIMVLSHSGTTRDAFWAVLESDGELLSRSVLQSSEGYEAFGPESLVRVMTIASAKGSEGRTVHLLEAEKLTTGRRELAFTAVTRAKTEVSLYHTKALPGHMVPPADASPDIDACF